MAQNFKLYNRVEYFRHIADFARRAGVGDRISLATMPFDPLDTEMKPLVQALCAAASQGATVHLLVDAFTFMQDNDSIVPGPLWYKKKLSGQLQPPYSNRLAALELLKNAGGHYQIINQPLHPFQLVQAGRSHLKFAVLNNDVFVGGCNLTNHTQIDVMVCWQDTQTADWLYDLSLQIYTTGSTKTVFGSTDRTHTLSSGNRLLIDAGIRNQSVIYDEALALIDQAEKYLYITCQYFPGGRTAKHLAAAHKRGVKVDIVFGHPSNHDKQAYLHYIYNFMQRLRFPATFFRGQLPPNSPKLHAKILLSEKAVMVGSHNYVSQGVTLGTTEICLVISNAQDATALHSFIIAQLPNQTS